ncbi:MAG: hypothetical protein ACKVY0_12700 [Prosthecobacter sp.]|uniref:hypothetical protein n=1 Tax=Prosthecobacter sp. TaxID=1965333 RepID=UPI003901BF9D
MTAPLIFALLFCSALPLLAAAGATHPPMRPLPVASARPLPPGPLKFVDTTHGSDAGDGSVAKPWRTLGLAVTKLAPGDTLVLRGGIYREHVTVKCAGTHEKPITIRSHPNELVILDGGIADFFDAPETAWEPFAEGAPGEFRSTKTYENAGSASTDDQMETTLLGSFADSMVPLQGCHAMGDLRSTNLLWTLGGSDKVSAEKFIYCGPSICYDMKTQRIHARFAHTTLQGLGKDNYRGETDPRRLKLVIATLNAGSVLTLREARYVRVQDIVVRGARMATVDVEDCAGIAFEGVTAYGGAAAIRVQGTKGLRMSNCALRGIAAPWTFRSSLKYRSIEARIFSASSWTPSGGDNADFEIAHCEFTDCVDGVFIGNVRGVNFHHNLVANVSDDGLFLTCGTAPDGTTHGGNVHLWQNRFERCLTVFAFGVGHGRQKMLPTGSQTGVGVWAHNNIFDLRQWVPYFQPQNAEEPQEFTFTGRLCGDHGSPAWEPLFFYHNTILAGNEPFRGGYLDGLGRGIASGSPRRLLNNSVVQAKGVPGTVMQENKPDFIGDGNLHWSTDAAAGINADEFLRKLRGARPAQELQAARHDLFADPLLDAVLRPQPKSPVMGAAVAIPQEWPAPLSTKDLGAIPAGSDAWHAGVKIDDHASLALPQIEMKPTTGKPVAIVEGYPAFDAPLVRYALRKQGKKVEVIERAWLDATRLPEFEMVVYAGSLARAKSPVTKFSADDLPRVRAFLEQGGTLVLLRATNDMFASDHGQAFLRELCGETPKLAAAPAQLLLPQHPWVKHLDASPHPWLAAKNAAPLRAVKGERILGTPEGLTTLCRITVGKGALIYVGWEIAESIPHGRLKATVEMERIYEEQYRVLEQVLGMKP